MTTTFTYKIANLDEQTAPTKAKGLPWSG